MASKKKAVAPLASTAVVLCDKDHRLPGLFVVFKLKPPTGDTPQEKLARVLEGSKKPTPPKPPVPVGDAPEDKKKKAAYDKLKAKYDADDAKYQEKKVIYDRELARFEDLPLDPADKFVLGIVDDDGFLQPVHDGFNPWYDIATKRDPDTYKLAKGETYLVVPLRHPDPAMARALVRHMNEEAVDADQVYAFGTWDGLDTPKEITLDTVSVAGADQVVLRLTETATDYYPPGPATYGNWTLYRDMPHQQCEGVGAQVRQLQENLGKLRFPGSETNDPFHAKNEDVRKKVLPLKFPPEKKPKKIKVDDFDGTLQAALARFQEFCLYGEAFVVDPAAEAKIGSNHWAYVFGKPLDFDPAVPVAKEPDEWVRDRRWEAYEHPGLLGVVDQDVADLLQHWIDKKLRKPPEILCPTKFALTATKTPGSVWMLERGALALDAWFLLCKACGCDYGVVPGSTLRNVSVGAWPGAILNSIHKTGLAIDMAGGATRESINGWPIRFEASWKKDDKSATNAIAKATKALDEANARVAKKQTLQTQLLKEKDPAKKPPIEKQLKDYDTAEADANAAKARLDHVKRDDKEGKIHWIQRWRIYGHSEHAVFDPKDGLAAVEEVRNALDDYAGEPWVAKPGKPGEFTRTKHGTLFTDLKGRYFPGLPDDLVDPWLRSRVVAIEDAARAISEMPAPELRAKFFRKKVVQWMPNFYEGDGGSSGKCCTPDGKDDAAHFPKRDGKAWLNLSALGYKCGIERIGPHSSDVRDQAWLKGPADPKALPKIWPLTNYFYVRHVEGDIVTMLEDITAKTDNQQHGHDDIPLFDTPEPTAGTKPIATYKPDQIDAVFARGWRDAVLSFDESFRPATDGSSDVKGAQIKLMLSVGKRKADLKDVTAALAGGFGGNTFVVTQAGDLAKIDVPAGKHVKGALLGPEIDAALDRFEKIATKNARDRQKAKDDAAKEAKDKKIKKVEKSKADLQKEKEAAALAERTEREAWTLFIQPIFEAKPDPSRVTFLPTHWIRLPRGASDAHLEWWHFQHVSAGSSWGSLLGECGFSLQVLGVPVPGDPRSARPAHRGLSYTDKDFSSSPGGYKAGDVENRDQFTPPDA